MPSVVGANLPVCTCSALHNLAGIAAHILCLRNGKRATGLSGEKPGLGRSPARGRAVCWVQIEATPIRTEPLVRCHCHVVLRLP